MSQHTPGPWQATKGYCPSIKAGDATIAVNIGARPNGPIGGQHMSEIDANASLIAAAPELLAACEAAILLWDREETIDPTQGEVDMIRAAIARAKGTA